MRIRPFLLVLAILVSFLAGTLIPKASTQSQPPKYFLVDYMKVDPAKGQEYLSVERDLWKPIHQAYAKSGKKRWWSLYGVQFPYGTDQKYGFVTVNAFDQFQQIEEPYSDLQEVLAKLHPNMKLDQFFTRTENSRQLVQGEVWVLIDHVE